MRKEFNRATFEVIGLLERRIEAEKSWLEHGEYTLSSARIINVLRNLIGEIFTLDDMPEEDKNGTYRLKIKVGEE